MLLPSAFIQVLFYNNFHSLAILRISIYTANTWSLKVQGFYFFSFFSESVTLCSHRFSVDDVWKCPTRVSIINEMFIIHPYSSFGFDHCLWGLGIRSNFLWNGFSSKRLNSILFCWTSCWSKPVQVSLFC